MLCCQNSEEGNRLLVINIFSWKADRCMVFNPRTFFKIKCLNLNIKRAVYTQLEYQKTGMLVISLFVHFLSWFGFL